MATRGEAWINGLWQSTVYSVPELFGIEAPKEVRQWRADNPIGSFASTMVGGTIPYVGWYATARKVQRFENLITKIGAAKMTTQPIRYSILREAGRFAPLEASRVIANQAVGDLSFGEALSRSAIDLATNSVAAGAAVGLYKSAKAGLVDPPTKESFDPPQLQMRANDNQMPNIPPEKMQVFNSRQSSLSKMVRSEEPDAGHRYVEGLANGKDADAIEKYFKPTGRKSRGDHITLKLYADKENFRKDADWLQEAGAAGIAQDFDRHSFYPRVVRGKTIDADQKIREAFEKNLVKVDDKTYMNIEPDEKFGIVAKRIPPSLDDLVGGWVLSKTDNLDWFDKNASRFMTRNADDMKWTRGEQTGKSAGFIGDGVRDLKMRFPLRALQMAVPEGHIYASFERVASMTGLGKAGATIKDQKEVRQFVDGINRYFVPRQFQTGKSQTATLINGIGQATIDRGRHLADEITYGQYTATVGKSIFAQSQAQAQKTARSGGATRALETLTDTEMDQIDDVLKREVPPNHLEVEVAEGRLSENARSALTKLKEANDRLGLEEDSVKKFYETNTKERTGSPFIVSNKWARKQGPETRGWNRRQLIEQVENVVRGRTQRMANVVIDNEAMELLRKLKVDNPGLFNTMVDRLNDLKGIKRPIESWMNKTIHKILPFAGKSSATQIANVTNRLMYPLTLGFFVPANAVMNVASLFTHTMPELLSVFNSSGLRPGLMSYLPAVGSNGQPVGTVGVLNTTKLMLSAGRKIFGGLSPEDLPFWQQGIREGIINPRFIAEAVGSDSTTGRSLVARFKEGDIVGATEQIAGFVTNESEQLARTWAFQAALDVGRAAGLTGDALYYATKQVTNRSMFGYAQADKAAFMTGPVGSVMGQFKNWMLHTMLMMGSYAGEGIKYGNWKPFLWQQMSIAGFGGLAASPMINAAEWANSMFSDDELMKNMYEMMEDEHADALFFGLPVYLGASLTGSATAPFTDPMRDISSIWIPTATNRVMAMRDTIGVAVDQWQAGTIGHPAELQDVQRGLMQIFAPRSFQRVWQSVQNGAIDSVSSGYPILKNPSISDKLMYAAGIGTPDLARRYYISDKLYRDSNARKALVSTLGTAYTQAMEQQDSMKMWQILQAATENGIGWDSVSRSASAKFAKGQLGMMERAADSNRRFEMFGPAALGAMQ